MTTILARRHWRTKVTTVRSAPSAVGDRAATLCFRAGLRAWRMESAALDGAEGPPIEVVRAWRTAWSQARKRWVLPDAGGAR